jgi:pimeloyl-ACP methyl ester carboxylesterase
MTTYADLPNLSVKTEQGLSLAYRDTGGDGRPVVLFQHFRGNLDNWDPALVDEPAAGRRVIAFDYEGVGGSEGTVVHTIAETAAGALRFLDALNLDQVDLLGFSIGSFVAQEIALKRPSVANRVVLASSAPKGAPNMHGWAAEVIGAVGTPQTSPEEYISVFFAPSDASKKAGQAALGRMYARKEERDTSTNWECEVSKGRAWSRCASRHSTNLSRGDATSCANRARSNDQQGAIARNNGRAILPVIWASPDNPSSPKAAGSDSHG